MSNMNIYWRKAEEEAKRDEEWEGRGRGRGRGCLRNIMESNRGRGRERGCVIERLPERGRKDRK